MAFKLNPVKRQQVINCLKLNYTIKQISLESGIPEGNIRTIAKEIRNMEKEIYGDKDLIPVLKKLKKEKAAEKPKKEGEKE